MENKKKFKTKDIVVLAVTIAILIAIVVLCACNWLLVVNLFTLIVQGKTVVQDYILSFGILGEIIISIMLIFCFFFPFISSLPLQILCVVSYGVWHATLLISITLALASQLLYLLEKNFKTFFYTKKQHQKQKDIEDRIKNSSRNINWVMVLLYIVPCIPFLIISSVACRSNMRWWKYTLFTAIGPIPEVIVTLLLGNQLTTNSSPVWSIIVLVIFIIAIVLSLIFEDKMIYWIFKPKKEINENILIENSVVKIDAIENSSNNNDTKSNNDDIKINDEIKTNDEIETGNYSIEVDDNKSKAKKRRTSSSKKINTQNNILDNSKENNKEENVEVDYIEKDNKEVNSKNNLKKDKSKKKK